MTGRKAPTGTTLQEALGKFDAVEANLVKLEKLWARMEERIPDGIFFCGFSPEQRAYDDLCRAFVDVLDALPAIDGWRITAIPMSLDDIAQARLDAKEVGDFESLRWAEESIFDPAKQVHEYRYRVGRKRRALVQGRVEELVAEVDAVLWKLHAAGIPERGQPGSMEGADWDALRMAVREVDHLRGSGDRGAHWNDLHRHLRFAHPIDCWDIIERDWPAVKRELRLESNDESAPVRVDIDDLETLVAAHPSGRVATAMRWVDQSDDDFERLLYCLIGDAAGYENPQWLTKTNAPDRGRDLSVDRVRSDSLAGTIRERVILQCKRWTTKSVGVDDVSLAASQMSLWSPPPVDVLVVVAHFAHRGHPFRRIVITRLGGRDRSEATQQGVVVG